VIVARRVEIAIDFPERDALIVEDADRSASALHS